MPYRDHKRRGGLIVCRIPQHAFVAIDHPEGSGSPPAPSAPVDATPYPACEVSRIPSNRTKQCFECHCLPAV